MPMQFGKVSIESPQEVLARLRQERQAMAASGNVSAISQATLSNGLDAIFGNPEVKGAQQLQQRLKAAQEGAQPQDGDDDITAEMRRISAMRDAVADLDPGLANEMTTQLLQLGTVKAEREKLMAQGQLARNRDQRGENKDQRDAIKMGFDVAAKAQEIERKSGEGQNFWKRVGSQIKHVAIPADASLERRKLMAEGWIEGTGPTSEAEANSIVGEKPTKPVQTDLQTQLLNANTQMDAFARIAQKFEPDFLTLPNKAIMKGVKIADAIGAGGAVPAELMGKYTRFIEFRANSIDAFNQYIKSITGAAMAVPEAERIQKGFVDAENDGPQEFVAKMRGTAQQVLGIQKRAALALQNGIPVTPENLQAMIVPTVSQEEVDTFLSRFGIPARGAAAKKPGTADKDGWITTQSGARVRKLK